MVSQIFQTIQRPFHFALRGIQVTIDVFVVGIGRKQTLQFFSERIRIEVALKFKLFQDGGDLNRIGDFGERSDATLAGADEKDAVGESDKIKRSGRSQALGVENFRAFSRSGELSRR